MNENNIIVATVIPCYKVRSHVLELLAEIKSNVDLIYVVDDCCPEYTGRFVEDNCHDPRIRVIYNHENLGVGGAVIAGYRQALADGATIVVKLDGDGQMDPSILMEFITPIIDGEADYTKGNRFYNLEEINKMPPMRIFGNAVLSFISKFSTGYWDVFDPTNGYTAIHIDVIRKLPLNKISKRYFFETDILFRLNSIRAVVVDVPMPAKYGDEVSNLKISSIIGTFMFRHAQNLFKRIFYNYYLRDMSIASLELPIGISLVLFGLLYGTYHWIVSANNGNTTPSGVVMLAALPIMLGVQFILAFLAYDIHSVPTKIIHRKNK